MDAVAKAIEDMVVRGAPAIGCAAAWGLAIDAINHLNLPNWSAYQTSFQMAFDRLGKTRPTAVNLFYALAQVSALTKTFKDDMPMSKVSDAITKKAQALTSDDIRTCKAIGEHGASMFNRAINILTHCNTGSLATAGYGTALGIIRSLHARGHVKNVWVDETRPYLQGSRLTAFELAHDGIPHTLISDNMAAYAMQRQQVDLVVVGADRIAANGDTANKIGTYNLAVLCKHHNIPFIVAAPKSTIDGGITSGTQIPVEERPPNELKEINGSKIAPVDSEVWNPSFDVTPAQLISAIVTEDGIFRGPNFRLLV
jgi:methylthioribose-1-phosphate isomerase